MWLEKARSLVMTLSIVFQQELAVKFIGKIIGNMQVRQDRFNTALHRQGMKTDSQPAHECKH